MSLIELVTKFREDNPNYRDPFTLYTRSDVTASKLVFQKSAIGAAAQLCYAHMLLVSFCQVRRDDRLFPLSTERARAWTALTRGQVAILKKVEKGKLIEEVVAKMLASEAMKRRLALPVSMEIELVYDDYFRFCKLVQANWNAAWAAWDEQQKLEEQILNTHLASLQTASPIIPESPHPLQ